MSDLKNNIKFNYLYRDAGNYKEFGSVIFEKKSQIDLKKIEAIIRSKLIDAEFFIPKKWNIPSLASFPFDPELDHQWHEIISIELTDEPVTRNKYIENFLEEITK